VKVNVPRWALLLLLEHDGCPQLRPTEALAVARPRPVRGTCLRTGLRVHFTRFWSYVQLCAGGPHPEWPFARRGRRVQLCGACCGRGLDGALVIATLGPRARPLAGKGCVKKRILSNPSHACSRLHAPHAWTLSGCRSLFLLLGQRLASRKHGRHRHQRRAVTSETVQLHVHEASLFNCCNLFLNGNGARHSVGQGAVHRRHIFRVRLLSLDVAHAVNHEQLPARFQHAARLHVAS